MLAFAPQFLGQISLGQTDVQRARGSVQLLVDSVDSEVSALPEGPVKQDLSERLIGCKNLLSFARDMASISQAQTCLTLLREDVMQAPKSVPISTSPSQAEPSPKVAYVGFLGIPTWVFVVGVAGAVGVGVLISESSGKPKRDKHIKVEPRKDGNCRKGSRHMRNRSGCWSEKTLD